MTADGFHNPYNFVPAAARRPDGPFGDRPPAGHDTLLPDHWTGRLLVTLQTVTPLLVPDSGDQPTDRNLPAAGVHRRYGTRVNVDADGTERVYLPPTSIKGMLRAAYEAVTNSRMGVFTHDTPLGYRASARAGADAEPVIVKIGSDGTVEGALTAAWLDYRDRPRRQAMMRGVALPAYPLGGARPCRYPDGSLPALGDHVAAWVELVDHDRYLYWRAVDVWRQGHDSDRPRPAGLGAPRSGGRHRPLGPGALVRGVVHRTNQNIERKHDERLFVTRVERKDPGVEVITPERLTIEGKVWDAYRALLQDYRDRHVTERKDEIWHRGAGLPRPWSARSTPGPDGPAYAWSRHLYDVHTGARHNLTDDERAAQGPDASQPGERVTCYALRDRSGVVTELLPVLISRRMHDRSPRRLLPSGVTPAASLDELSMAERVFGWVRQPEPGEKPGENDGRDTAVRGALRVGPVRGPRPDDALTRAEVPLEILSAPKPSQGRFYVGALGADGLPSPLPRAATKESAFGDPTSTPGGRALRGRKVYPHQRELEGDQDYWNPLADGRAREYRRPGNARQPGGITDDQNRTVTSWVKVGEQFRFTIDVRNLDDLELGALIWLLRPELLGTPDQPGRHRLGGGKPFGFGAVAVTLDQDGHDLRRGQDWATDIATLGEPPAAPAQGWRELAEAFEERMRATPAGTSILQAVRDTAIGFTDGAPVHHPRTRPEKDPNGENYKWFVANEAAKHDEPRQALPPIGGTLRYQGAGETGGANRRGPRHTDRHRR